MTPEKIQEVRKLLSRKKLDKLKTIYSNEDRPLRPYQNLGAFFMFYVDRCILADACGLGKTPQTLTAFALAKQRDPSLKLLLISEASTLYQWKDEAESFLKNLPVQVVVTPPPHRRKGWPSTQSVRRYYYQMSGADIFVVSQKVFEADWENHAIHDLVEQSMVVLDEATAAKNPKTKLHIAVAEASRVSRGLKLLTATPIYRGLEDYYGLMKLVDRTLFGTKKKFMEEFCKTKKLKVRKGRKTFFMDQITGFKNEDKFHERCSHVVLRRTPQDVGEQLPEVIEKPILLSMCEAQTKIYEAATAGKYNVLDEGDIDIEDETQDVNEAQKMVIVTQRRQMQAANHPALLGESAPSVKLEKLLQLLEGPLDGMKVLVYSESRKCVDLIQEAIKKRIKRKTVRITGAENAKKRNENQKKFHGDVDICLITRAAEKGVNLQCAKAFVFFDQPWAWGARNQLLGRICRIGSTHDRVLSILLMARDTVDEDVYKVLSVRAETVEKTFGDKDLMKVTPFMLDTIVRIMRGGRTADEALLAFAESNSEAFERYMEERNGV